MHTHRGEYSGMDDTLHPNGGAFRDMWPLWHISTTQTYTAAIHHNTFKFTVQPTQTQANHNYL